MAPIIPVDACPLCGSRRYVPISAFVMRDIWEGLRSAWGASFSDCVVRAHSPAETANLVRCNDCGLDYFVGAACGNANFYAELSGTSNRYYVARKWEFDFVARIVNPGVSLLDIGCGSGAFLNEVKDKVRLAVGIDTNSEGVRQATRLGVNAAEIALEDYVVNHRNEFDYVCVFQVVEHLSSVAEFLSLAMSLVKPGGRLVVSVPNTDRIVKGEFEPLDCPPHHISRWHEDQFPALSRLLGCRIEMIAREPASPYSCRMHLERRLSKIFFPEVSERPALVIRAISRVLFLDSLYGLYKKLGLLSKWRLFGHSMVVVLRK